MFRRVEVIHPASGKWFPADWKDGLMSACSIEVIDTWIHHLMGSRRTLPTNARFYFTEKAYLRGTVERERPPRFDLPYHDAIELTSSLRVD